MQTKVLETDYAQYLVEDGIMVITYATNLIITLDIAKEMIEDRIRFSGGVTMPILVDIRGLASVDTLSRKYFVSPRALEYTMSGALVVESMISKLAGNIYITVDKPAVPMKLFTNKDKAITWLKKFKKYATYSIILSLYFLC